jgi:4,4'-diaponeurosporenoate glycosyltransferase
MIGIVLFGWIAGWLLFVHFRRCAVEPNECKLTQTISIIVPAREEEENLPRLLRSIAAHEVIVVDDCSSDRTAAIAHEYGVRVIDGMPPPNGWRGKTWACQEGADSASGELLLFLDADTWLERDGINVLVDEFRSGAVSIAPHHHVPSAREQFSAFFNLMMLAGAGPRHLLGQSLLIERATYERIGGHRAVKDQLLENFALGEKVGHVETRLGRGVINVRMYPHGWREMIDGWSKSFAIGAAHTAFTRLALAVMWMTGCTLAVIHPATYALFVLQLAILLRRIGSYRVITVLLYPIPLVFFFAVFARSVLRTRAGASFIWKGRPVRAA